MKSKNDKIESNVEEDVKASDRTIKGIYADIGIKNPNEFDEDGNLIENEMLLPDTHEHVKFGVDRKEENEEIMALFPFLGTIKNIVNATVVNAKPTLKCKLPLPPKVTFDLNTLLEESIYERYKLDTYLRDIVSEETVGLGSSTFISIPFESYKEIIDSTHSQPTKKVLNDEVDIIKVMAESEALSRNRRNVISEVNEDLKFSITDSLTLLELGNKRIKDAKRSSSFVKVEDDMNELMNLFSDINNPKIEEALFIGSKNDDFSIDGFHSKLESEFIVPIMISGTHDAIGYIYALGEHGNTMENPYGELANEHVIYSDNFGNTSELKKYLDDAKKEISKEQKESPKLDMGTFETYTTLFKKHLKNMFEKSTIGDVISTPDLNNLMGIMFNRAVEAKMTRLLYLPADIVTYYAYDYRRNNTGKSILEDSYHLLSILAMLTFAKVRGEVENNISQKIVDVVINPKNKNPQKYMKQFIAQFTEGQNKGYKWGTQSIRETSRRINQVGITYRFKHDRIPWNEVNVDNKIIGSGNTVSDEFMDKIRTDIYRKFSLTKAMIDGADDNDFASISILTNDLSKIFLSDMQTTLMRQFSNHIQQVVRIDSKFMVGFRLMIQKNRSSIISSLGANFKKRLKQYTEDPEKVNKFLELYIIRNLIGTLPTLRNEDESTLEKRYKAFKDMVESMVDEMVFSDESLPDDFVGTDIGNVLSAYKTSYKNMLLSNWLRENNYMLELVNVMTVTDGKIDIDHLSKYIGNLQALAEALKPYGQHFKKLKRKMDRTAKSYLEGGMDEDDVKTKEDRERELLNDGGEYREGKDETIRKERIKDKNVNNKNIDDREKKPMEKPEKPNDKNIAKDVSVDEKTDNEGKIDNDLNELLK